eukprot:UN29447
MPVLKLEPITKEYINTSISDTTNLQIEHLLNKYSNGFTLENINEGDGDDSVMEEEDDEQAAHSPYSASESTAEEEDVTENYTVEPENTFLNQYGQKYVNNDSSSKDEKTLDMSSPMSTNVEQIKLGRHNLNVVTGGRDAESPHVHWGDTDEKEIITSEQTEEIEIFERESGDEKENETRTPTYVDPNTQEKKFDNLNSQLQESRRNQSDGTGFKQNSPTEKLQQLLNNTTEDEMDHLIVENPRNNSPNHAPSLDRSRMIST